MGEDYRKPWVKGLGVASYTFVAIELIGALCGAFWMSYDQRGSHAWLAAFIFYLADAATFSLCGSIPISFLVGRTVVARARKG
jgi:hypothetical protein